MTGKRWGSRSGALWLPALAHHKNAACTATVTTMPAMLSGVIRMVSQQVSPESRRSVKPCDGVAHPVEYTSAGSDSVWTDCGASLADERQHAPGLLERWNIQGSPFLIPNDGCMHFVELHGSAHAWAEMVRSMPCGRVGGKRRSASRVAKQARF